MWNPIWRPRCHLVFPGVKSPTGFWCIALKLPGSIYQYTLIPGGYYQLDPNSKMAPRWSFARWCYTIMFHSLLIGLGTSLPGACYLIAIKSPIHWLKRSSLFNQHADKRVIPLWFSPSIFYVETVFKHLRYKLFGWEDFIAWIGRTGVVG